MAMAEPESELVTDNTKEHPCIEPFTTVAGFPFSKVAAIHGLGVKLWANRAPP